MKFTVPIVGPTGPCPCMAIQILGLQPTPCQAYAALLASAVSLPSNHPSRFLKFKKKFIQARELFQA